MLSKKYAYKDIDGNHWSDADKGDDLWYSVNFSCWVVQDNETVTAIDWTTPDGVTEQETYVEGTVAAIRLLTNACGTYKITCKITSIDNGRTQTNHIPMMLKVL